MLLHGRAVLFAGPSRAVRNTLLHALAQAGCAVLADEAAVCDRDDDGTWVCSAFTCDDKDVAEPSAPVRLAPVGLLVHLRRRLPAGFRITPCSDLQSASLGCGAVLAASPPDPRVRAERFRAFSAFARAVPALILDHASDTGFLPVLAGHLKPVPTVHQAKGMTS